MKIAIISAMEKERQLIMPLIESCKKIDYDGLTSWEGTLLHHDVALVECGIGKVNAAINTYKLIKNFRPELLINTGVAGGVSDRTRIGDILVADYVAYHDVWCGPGTEIGVADGMDVFMACDTDIIEKSYHLFSGQRLQVGLICSGDRFISTPEETLEILKIFPEAIAVDMESAAIAQVCCLESVKFNIVRVVSDTPGSGENIAEYKNFWKEAPEKTFETVRKLLREV